MGFITISNTGTSTWTTHRVTMEEMKNALGTPLMTPDEWRAMFDPKRQEVTVHHKSDMKHYAHARLGQCPNCGANDWMPTFMLQSRPIVQLPYVVNSVARMREAMAIKKELEDRDQELYEVVYYSCAYCGTRKDK